MRLTPKGSRRFKSSRLRWTLTQFIKAVSILAISSRSTKIFKLFMINILKPIIKPTRFQKSISFRNPISEKLSSTLSTSRYFRVFVEQFLKNCSVYFHCRLVFEVGPILNNSVFLKNIMEPLK